jgi:hypothetical protein
MTACRCASPSVADVALASAAVIRVLPAARWLLSVEHVGDSGTVDVVDVLLVVDGDVLEVVEEDEVELVDDDEEDDEDELVDDEEDEDEDEDELLDDDDEEEDEDEDEELGEEDDELVPAAKLIERWAK